MWIFTLDGFYSAVQDKSDKDLIWVRSRVKEDLTRLIDTYEVNASEIYEDAGTDYKFRICVWREEWVRVVADCVNDIDYNNFKGACLEELGKDRARVLGEVWLSMMKLQINDAQKMYYGSFSKAHENIFEKKDEGNPGHDV